MRILLKDDRLKTLQVYTTKDGKTTDTQDLIEGWATEALLAWADDKELVVDSNTIEMVGAFFPEDFCAKADAWNSDIGEYCKKMLDYVVAGIAAKEDFWKMNPADNYQRYELYRVACLAYNQWFDYAKFMKLGFDNGEPMLTQEELGDIKKNPASYVIIDGVVK